MTAMFQKFFTWLFEKYAVLLVSKIWEYILSKQKQAEQEAQDEKNAQALKDAVTGGKSDAEIAKAAQDLLNGNTP